MRVSIRRAVKVAAFFVAFLLLNALIGEKLSLFGESAPEKVLGHPRHDNGDPKQVVASVAQPSAAGSDGLERLRRNTHANEHKGLEVSESGRKGPGKPKENLSSKLAPGQPLSHAGLTDISDIFISVKTSGKFHASRLKLVTETWFILAREQTTFFTDTDDAEMNEATGGHLINTNCSSSHTRQSLCCKMSVEFDAYLESRKRWMCHFDDDIYVNIPVLVKLLQNYQHTEDWYLGKPSMRHPIEMEDPSNRGMKIVFGFATGSAFCISRGLALKMMPHAGGGRLMAIGEKLRLPDDCVIGYIVEHLLNEELTVIKEFRSHLEALVLIKPYQLKKQITLSYSRRADGRQNVVNIEGFTAEEDPTRFKSIHCHLFPTFRECRKLQS
ncbi:hypothetical protein BaRGS_00010562 [Batillaria attramentaria]|uniref:Fringe-like glycosyltransferase domain-containing protein n=1 Tax=Batillaria attramentaria TaxID=370345 RepID=A0ABD0LFS6_9CAEN